MGWFSTDYYRLEIFMAFQLFVRQRFGIKTGWGAGGVRWKLLRQHPTLDETSARIILAVLHYGRILTLYRDTRAELFERVGEVAGRLISGEASIEFAEWKLNMDGGEFPIWPWAAWEDGSRNTYGRPKTWSVTLKEWRGSRRLAVHLKMAWGLERIFGPASVLLTLSDLECHLSDFGDRKFLGALLMGVNRYYGTSERVGAPNSEEEALSSALQMLAGGTLAEQGE